MALLIVIGFDVTFLLFGDLFLYNKAFDKFKVDPHQLSQAIIDGKITEQNLATIDWETVQGGFDGDELIEKRNKPPRKV